MSIDGLDECAGVHRAMLLDSLREILEKSPGTRIFVTGRPHIRAEIERRLSGRVTCVSVSPTRGDIIGYLRVRISQDEMPEAMDKSLEADILQMIPENISEMCVHSMTPGIPPQCMLIEVFRFLLASLNIEAILQEPTIYRRRERLCNMTVGLEVGDAYARMIERIKAQGGNKSRLGIAALMWISHAELPLAAQELCHALAVELGSTNFTAGNTLSILTLVACCQGLITVDREASAVRLIHFTLREYLSSSPDIFSNPHSAIAEICLTYLSSEEVWALSADPHPDTRGRPFLEYCSLYWGVHAKKELSACARSLALGLLQEYDGHRSTGFLLCLRNYRYPSYHPRSLSFNGLHCASFFGIVDIVTGLLEVPGYDINKGGFEGRTPLAWAAQNGHEGVARVLLEREEINPEKPGNRGQTPLSVAAGHGHQGIVSILLEQQDVNPENMDHNGRTPLSYAAENGGEEVVKVLLGQEVVNPENVDGDGRTPLSYAASGGHEGVVEILLALDIVNPDKRDLLCRTPLLLAARNGHECVVRMLLAREEVLAQHRSTVPLVLDMREWCKCCSRGKRSTPTNRLITAPQRSRRLLSVGVIKL